MRICRAKLHNGFFALYAAGRKTTIIIMPGDICRRIWQPYYVGQRKVSVKEGQKTAVYRYRVLLVEPHVQQGNPDKDSGECAFDHVVRHPIPEESLLIGFQVGYAVFCCINHKAFILLAVWREGVGHGHLTVCLVIICFLGLCKRGCKGALANVLRLPVTTGTI